MRYCPLFGDQSLDLFVNQITDLYDNKIQVYEKEQERLEDRIAALVQEIEDMEEERQNAGIERDLAS